MTFLLLLLCVSVVRAQHFAYYNHPSVGLPYYNAVPQSVYPGIPVTHPSGLRTSTFYGNTQFLSQYPSHAQQQFQPTPAETPFVTNNIHIQKQIELQKPAIKTIRYELRRPAIQNKFYDIEEHVIVRPVGSAVLELNQRHSKVPKSSVMQAFKSEPVQEIHALHVQPFAPPQQQFALTQQLVVPPQQFPPTQQFAPAQQFIPAQQFAPEQQFTPPQPFAPEQQQLTSPSTLSENAESIVVEAEQLQSIQKPSQNQKISLQEIEPPMEKQPQFKPAETISRNSSDQSITQQRLIELLTAKDGVAEMKFDSSAFKNVDDAGQVRVQVLSADLAPKDTPIAGEKVKTRRVVISRPIETIEEVDVEVPAAKVSRMAMQKQVTPVYRLINYNIPLQTSVPHLSKQTVYYQ